MKCINDPEICEKSKNCSLRNLLKMANRCLCDVFDGHTLADLIQWEKQESGKAAS
jgi:hypothetical protein